MKEIVIELGRRSYPVFVGKNLSSSLPKKVRKILSAASRVILVTHPELGRRYGRKLKGGGQKIETLLIPAGERTKSLETVQKIYKTLLKKKADRNSLLLALGGGVVGDICGFVAATYLRGVTYAQIPTTLLAQVDAAIGGKTGVNLGGKNLVGAFWQPCFVLSDLSFLKTLPEADFRAGLAEVIKYGVIGDPKLFQFLERQRAKILSRDPQALEFIVARSTRAKGLIVSHDELETKGIRMLLNFGHTFGHAIEKLGHYRRWLHGEAVARGMLIASELSVTHGFCAAPVATRLRRLLLAYGLLAKPLPFSRKRLLVPILLDKKMKNGRIRFVFMKKIGEVVVQEMKPSELG